MSGEEDDRYRIIMVLLTVIGTARGPRDNSGRRDRKSQHGPPGIGVRSEHVEFFAGGNGPDDDPSVGTTGYEHEGLRSGRGGEAGCHKSFDKVGVAIFINTVWGARAGVPGMDAFVPATGEKNEWVGGGLGRDGEACCGSCGATIWRRDFIILQKMERGGVSSVFP